MAVPYYYPMTNGGLINNLHESDLSFEKYTVTLGLL